MLCFSPHNFKPKEWSNAVEFSLSDRCCIKEKFCGIHLTTFLAFCYSIDGKKKKSDFDLFSTTDRNYSCSPTSASRNFTPEKTILENLTSELGATNIK